MNYTPPADRPNGNDVLSLIRHLVDVARGVRLLFQGKTNNTGTLTLTANTTTTVLSDPRLTVESFVGLQPLTANAAAALATTYAATADQNNITWTFTHANAATTDRTFRYVIVG
jgi:hypothetical protein